jgi:HEAT repeat protein
MSTSLRQLLDELKSAPPEDGDLYALSNLDQEGVEAVKAVWHDLPLERRRDVTPRLVRIAERDIEANFNGFFRMALEDADPSVRESAIEGLWEERDVRLITLLIRHLREDPSPDVRAAAAISLGRFILMGELGKIHPRPHERAYDALMAVCCSDDEPVEVHRRALEAVSYSGEEAVPPLIEAAHRHPDERMRTSAVFAMGRSADPQWASRVMAELHSPNPEMRYEAARACGKLALEAALSVLIDLVEDVDAEVQDAAIWSLGQIGGEDARRVLEECQRADSEAVRVAASAALRELEFLHGDIGAILFPFDTDEDEEDWGEDEDFL